MAYNLRDHHFLFVDPHLAGKLYSPAENQGDGSLAAWKNYGGDKTWPAPQGWETEDQWHGPPDPILDSGRYRLKELSVGQGTAALHMVSPEDQRTGIEISRRFRLGPATSRVQLDLAFRNIAERTVRWSIWDVVQLAAEHVTADGSRSHDPTCCVTAPVNQQSRFAQGYNVMFGAADNPQWQVRDGLFWAEYGWHIGKVGLDSRAGWIAFYQGSTRRAFVERFHYEDGGEYPDGGATVECWTIGAGQVANLDYAHSGIYLMETEVLGPLQTLAPAESSTALLEWAACACEGPVLDVQEGGCTAERLAVAESEGGLHLRGRFGVFDVGTLQVAWRHAPGERQWREMLGRVGPLEAVTVDHRVERPPANAAIELYVIADGDGQPHLLAQK
jgi:hypothetical protein